MTIAVRMLRWSFASTVNHMNWLCGPLEVPRKLAASIPDLDLVVSINGGSYGEFTKWYRWGLQLVPQYIIPALSQKDERNR